jgi:hypothetical protein
MDGIYLADKGISNVSYVHGQGYLDSVKGDRRLSDLVSQRVLYPMKLVKVDNVY